ncbi:MAG: ABC transporter ATP-binding protein/permease [Clostridia bacterium]|nr:ABC transporter ATP-binding protein/permease [Clostridia bacterium]
MAIVVEKLEKTYKVKKGADVRALKGISFNLPDTGMVFILGKSGCGKSTLLNILGGLDGFDGGDIQIDGKSIKGYKANDLDGYRNDYLGFVFQENNLLEKENVRRNVGLALDLQSLKDKEGKVDGVLESVGLKEFADRKCNCLSGGQKQRVAIARALIKQPKLLLCDEPTGALDSETGEEIFNLLKELSGERLVVVVSHDRESAEKYGDRVIELKDGEIISDSSPQSVVEAAEQTKVKHGSLRFIRAFTMGVSYIIARPVRMAICLLLCLITFTCVGVIDTFNAFDRYHAMMYTMDELGSKNYAFCKNTFYKGESLMAESSISLKNAEELSTLLDVDRCDYIYTLYNSSLNVENTDGDSNWARYARVRGYLETDSKLLNDYGYKLVAGRLPANTDEVALPLYLFNFYKTYGYKDGDSVIEIGSYEGLIGKTVGLQIIEKTFTITGIIDTNFVYKKLADILFNGVPYDKLMDYGDVLSNMEDIEQDVIHNTLFVCNGFSSYYTENFSNLISESNFILRVIAPYNGSDARKLKNLKACTTQYDGVPVSINDPDNIITCYHLINYAAEIIMHSEGTFNIVRDCSIYALLGAILITVLFLTYYASGTISEKHREIGILRALGASRLDILKIIASEHGTFAAGSIAISSVIGLITTICLNNTFNKTFGFGTVFIKFGIRQFAVVAAVAILAVAVGVAFPLIKLLRKKPVDVIADRK